MPIPQIPNRPATLPAIAAASSDLEAAAVPFLPSNPAATPSTAGSTATDPLPPCPAEPLVGRRPFLFALLPSPSPPSTAPAGCRPGLPTSELSTGARHLFDEMPLRLVGAAAATGEDRIGALPDDLLLHVLSFLPVHDAVRTCVLSRRWREVWKSLRVLRFTKPQLWESATKFNRFVNGVLFFRNQVPLEEFTFETYKYDAVNPPSDKDEKKERVKFAQRWIMYALARDVRVLRVLVKSRLSRPQLRPVPLLRLSEPLISCHLMTLELKSVVLTDSSMDFSSCPALKNLQIRHSQIWTRKISSQSLSHLIIKNCEFCGDMCTQILAPNLSSLLLDVRSGRVPYLSSAVLLATAYIRLDQFCRDRCCHSNWVQCVQDTCVDCYGGKDRSGNCVLLRGLSNAQNLELAVQFPGYIPNRAAAIFKHDMKLCPIFSNLKSLVLSGWAVACDLDALICFLQHTPILEKITLQLNGLNYNVEMEESYSSVENIGLPEHLKLVEVRCQKIAENVHKFVDILNAYGITSDIINIVEMDVADPNVRHQFEEAKW